MLLPLADSDDVICEANDIIVQEIIGKVTTGMVTGLHLLDSHAPVGNEGVHKLVCDSGTARVRAVQWNTPFSPASQQQHSPCFLQTLHVKLMERSYEGRVAMNVVAEASLLPQSCQRV